MNYRRATIYAQTDASTAKTQTIDIDLNDVISRIQIKFNSTNNGHTSTAHHATAISKVELVNGADVHYSLSAKQIEVLMHLSGLKTPYEREFRNDVENYLVLDMMFGRELYDEVLGYDPTRFTNPQLRITHDKASGGSAPDAATLEVFADVFDERKVSPIGFIMPHEYHSFTSAASAANEYVTLPNDYPIRRIILQTSKAGSWWENLVSEVELNENEGKSKPIEVSGGDLVQLANTKYGPTFELIAATTPGVGTYSWHIMPTDTAYGFVNWIGGAATEYIVLASETTGGYVSLVNASVQSFKMFATGFVPHGCVPIDLGKPNEIESWYDVTTKGKVKLRLKAAGEVTFNTILEQLRRY
jgi:hypothetical protein